IRARCMTGTVRGCASTAARLTDYLLQAKNDPPRIGTALVSRYGHCPGFAGKRQFFLDPFALQKQALAAGSEEWLGQTKQTVELRTSAGGPDAERLRRHRLDSTRPNCRVGLGDPNSVAQKSGFSRIGFHQLDTGHAEDRQDEPGETGTAPQ